ncbi:GD10156 [Drosophila simulans]|uniref:GD10156 n=1 Tax=Drosophila simulans TaxID=7240 RepID=B4QFU2_DROSI|nr:GD10156 [Drosophila simulans]
MPPRPTADVPKYPPGPPRPTADRPEYPPRPYEGSTPPSYGPRPSPSYDPDREPRPDYTNRPDPPSLSPQVGYGMNGPSARPPPPPYEGPPPPRDEYVRRNGSAMRPGDGYGGYDDDKTIATYFNPDDYMQGNNKRPMPGDRDRDRNRDRLGYPMDEMKVSSGNQRAGKLQLCDRPITCSTTTWTSSRPGLRHLLHGDDMDVCRQPPPRRHDTAGPSTALSDPRNAQCFFRAIDATRFFKSIVRDSLTVRSVGECEMECIRSTKFTCRAFAFRYGQQRHAGVIDNCQLSDWPVRDMDKERHLILDAAFDIFERASYGHGCEIQPIVDEKHKKLCYLGYGSPARLLPPAIKKVISVPSEMACKKECIRFRETTPFKCFAFSYGSHASSFNCELSDLDQTELKQDVHYAHTKDRDFWLFAWNPFDWTCRDKVNTIGGSRVNNDRRMDIFREPGDVAWRHYTVSGKPCRRSSPCAKNLITGFYSCETDASEVGSWDYCCKADHPCGYSKGFDYPWCFVGDESDQWRKCSDRYFPGKNGTQPTHSHLGLPSAKEKQKHPHPHHSQPATAASSEYSQHPPRPGGLQSLSDFAAARLWPVTYLYSEGPPNATEFSNFVDCNKESC